METADRASGRNYVPEEVAERMGAFFRDGLRPMFDVGLTVQEEVLSDLITLGRASRYAEDHGFGGIRTKEEFRSRVPVSEYADYRPYVAENMKEDAQQLSALETEYYLMSTGNSGAGKYYAETRLGALARQLCIDLWNLMLTKAVPRMTDPDVRMLAVTNCSPLGEAENGKAVRRTSSQAAKGLWEKHPQVYVYPYAFLEAEMSGDDRDYLTAVYTVKEKHFHMLFCNNLAYFGGILDWIEKCPQRIIGDIRSGVLTAKLSDADRAILQSTFHADPARAEELQRILDENGRLVIDAVWPEFIFAGGWLGGSIGVLAKDVMRRLPDRVQYLSESYGSTEAMYNIPLDFNCPYGPAAVYSCYFEFLPLDGSGEIVDLAHVEDGAHYEMLISTYSGLYRYNLHDIVCIRGYTGETPNIEFCCRSAESFPVRAGAAAPPLYGYELIELLERAEAESGCRFTFYQGLAEDGALSVAVQPAGAAFDGPGFAACLGGVLRRAGVRPGRLFVMPDTYCDTLFKRRMTNGRNVQSIKLSLVAERETLQALRSGCFAM